MTTATESLADQAYRRVRRMICTAELEPGAVISEAELCEQLGAKPGSGRVEGSPCEFPVRYKRLAQALIGVRRGRLYPGMRCLSSSSQRGDFSDLYSENRINWDAVVSKRIPEVGFGVRWFTPFQNMVRL